MGFKVTVSPSGRSFEVGDDESVLDAALRQGMAFPYGCRNGFCGACKGKLRSGQVHYDEVPRTLEAEERAAGIELLCKAHALSDLEIEVNMVGEAETMPVKTLTAKIERKEVLASDTVRLLLRLPEGERLQFRAGQYIDILLEGGRHRSYSLANAPHEDKFLELHISYVSGGRFTTPLFGGMQEKDIVRIEGPHGTFQLDESSPRRILFLCAGTGFAPVRAMLSHLIAEHCKRPIDVYCGAASAEGLYMDKQMQAWSRQHSNIRYVPILSRARDDTSWQGRHGHVQEALLSDHGLRLAECDVYACGPPAMVKDAHGKLTAAGLPPKQFFSDPFEFAGD